MAEELEHISSKKLIDRLDEYLGFPKSDPHGDPIPDGNGKFERVEQVNLFAIAAQPMGGDLQRHQPVFRHPGTIKS